MGDQQATRPPEQARASAQVLLLTALTATLSPRELDEVLTQGRALADHLT